jgi:hypothetical protein
VGAAVLLVSLGGASATVAAAGTEESVPDVPTLAAAREDAPTDATAAAPGLRAFIDLETGELTSRPSPEQLRSFVMASRLGLSRSFVGLRPFVLDDGGRGVNLQGRFQSALRVQRLPDGSFRSTCGDPAHAGAAPHSHDGPTAPRPDAGESTER